MRTPNSVIETKCFGRMQVRVSSSEGL
jgi:hypothetical protein